MESERQKLDYRLGADGQRIGADSGQMLASTKMQTVGVVVNTDVEHQVCQLEVFEESESFDSRNFGVEDEMGWRIENSLGGSYLSAAYAAAVNIGYGLQDFAEYDGTAEKGTG